MSGVVLLSLSLFFFLVLFDFPGVSGRYRSLLDPAHAIFSFSCIASSTLSSRCFVFLICRRPLSSFLFRYGRARANRQTAKRRISESPGDGHTCRDVERGESLERRGEKAPFRPVFQTVDLSIYLLLGREDRDTIFAFFLFSGLKIRRGRTRDEAVATAAVKTRGLEEVDYRFFFLLTAAFSAPLFIPKGDNSLGKKNEYIYIFLYIFLYIKKYNKTLRKESSEARRRSAYTKRVPSRFSTSSTPLSPLFRSLSFLLLLASFLSRFRFLLIIIPITKKYF